MTADDDSPPENCLGTRLARELSAVVEIRPKRPRTHRTVLWAGDRSASIAGADPYFVQLQEQGIGLCDFVDLRHDATLRMLDEWFQGEAASTLASSVTPEEGRVEGIARARAWEAGLDAYLSWWWNELLADTDELFTSAAMHEAHRAASKDPVLRDLIPYQSAGRLVFSAASGGAWIIEPGIAHVVGDEYHLVAAGERVWGPGRLDEVIGELASRFAPLGPAVHGQLPEDHPARAFLQRLRIVGDLPKRNFKLLDLVRATYGNPKLPDDGGER